MDAAEIARLRERPDCTETLRRVLDALKQAWKERDEARDGGANIFATLSVSLQQAISERDAAQQSVKDARALLLEARQFLDLKWVDEDALRSRIEAELRKP